MPENEVTIAQGHLRGTIEGELRVFRGVRYAAALTSQRRFMAPQDATNFAGIYAATASGAICPQELGNSITGEEDCLFANIWAHRDTAIRPVIVYLHGGASGGLWPDLGKGGAGTLCPVRRRVRSVA